jgi:elongation factor P hydroxylase
VKKLKVFLKEFYASSLHEVKKLKVFLKEFYASSLHEVKKLKVFLKEFYASSLYEVKKLKVQCIFKRIFSNLFTMTRKSIQEISHAL